MDNPLDAQMSSTLPDGPTRSLSDAITTAALKAVEELGLVKKSPSPTFHDILEDVLKIVDGNKYNFGPTPSFARKIHCVECRQECPYIPGPFNVCFECSNQPPSPTRVSPDNVQPREYSPGPDEVQHRATSAATSDAGPARRRRATSDAGPATVLGLPADYKPKRGRGRQAQLANMTTAQKKEDQKRRRERNRVCAQEARKRKKLFTVALEQQVAEYEEKINAQEEEIESLQRKIENLKRLKREL